MNRSDEIATSGLSRRMVNAFLGSGLLSFGHVNEILESGKPLRGVGDVCLQEYARYLLDHGGRYARLPWLPRYSPTFRYPDAVPVKELEADGYHRMTHPYSAEMFWALEYVLADMRAGKIEFKIGIEPVEHVVSESTCKQRDGYSVWRKGGIFLEATTNNGDE